MVCDVGGGVACDVGGGVVCDVGGGVVCEEVVDTGVCVYGC